ncbi:hypothetical protein [Alienimonas sp. DA493]|uniref:hypothetical protein n=1 Tax=Alienimonas sp. DA493 TaxID=3373605 RepID=UPI003754658B
MSEPGRTEYLCDACGLTFRPAELGGEQYCLRCGTAAYATDGAAVIAPDGPTNLTLGALAAAMWSSYRERLPGFALTTLAAVLLTGGWSFALLVLLALLLTTRDVRFSPATALAVGTLWGVGVSAVGFRTVAGLVDHAVRIARGAATPAGRSRFLFAAWGGRFAACGIPPVLVTATCVLLPLFASDWTGVDQRTCAVAAGLAAAVVPAAQFALLWPTPYLIRDRDDLTGLRPLAAAWRFVEGVRFEATAAGLLAYALLAWPLGLFFGGMLLAPNTPVPFYTVGATVLLWPFTAPPAFLLLAHAHDRIARLDAAAAEEAGDE